MYVSYGISILFSSVSKAFYEEFSEALVILLIILLPSKSPVASAVFLNWTF